MSSDTPKTDQNTTLQDLKNAFTAFRDERGWGKAHTPRNLAMSIAIEAAELMEHFQWGDYAQADTKEVEAELADVLSYCISLADAMHIDVATAFFAKLEHNGRKYPTTVFKPGQDDPDTYAQIKQSYRQGKTQA